MRAILLVRLLGTPPERPRYISLPQPLSSGKCRVLQFYSGCCRVPSEARADRSYSGLRSHLHPPDRMVAGAFSSSSTAFPQLPSHLITCTFGEIVYALTRPVARQGIPHRDCRPSGVQLTPVRWPEGGSIETETDGIVTTGMEWVPTHS